MMQTFEIEGHRLKLLRNGAEYFPELIAAIDAATQSVYLETYIYAADETGRQVSDALKRAARRGVGCYVMMDGFGSAALPQNWVASLRKAGVDVLHYRPESARWKMRRHRLRRMHRKIVVVDGEVDLGIRRSLKATQLPAAARDYLSPRQRMVYFFEPVSADLADADEALAA